MNKKLTIGVIAAVSLILILIIVYFLSLAVVPVPYKNEENATDYSKSEHWLSLPASVDKEVDVFYLYPTAWTSTDPNPQICDIDNPSMLVLAPQAFERQATAFETVGNIYAPYYRQLNIEAVSMPHAEEVAMLGGIPTSDAISAFDYYIRHHNNGRPFILVGHSQGANVLSNLLAEYMKENPMVYERMIAAYVIGYPVTPAYLADNPHLRFAEGPDDTGVIISYNTQAPDVLPGTNPILMDMVGLVINPITWTRDETVATTAQGLGSTMPDPATLQFVPVPQYADAKVDQINGVLICSTADEEALYPITAGLGKGIYHTFDIPFYYYNLRANAENRTKNFLSEQSTDKIEENATDYSKSEHWLSLPTSVDKEVDVFFLYPTCWQKVNNSDPNICDIDNPSMLIGAKICFYKDATAFETVGNIYAPYYRQADGAYTASLPSLEEQDKFAGGIPKSDVFAAFDYYIKNYNNGRPFIIAGHSQGSVMARFLLSEYMKENPEVYNRMIAAYVIGYSVTDEYLAKNPHLKFAEGSDDTGVIISYNTEAPTIEGNSPVVFPGAIAINPITWTREETLATAEQSLGSRILNAQLQAVSIKNYADAQVNKTKGVVITTTVDAKESSAAGLPGIYHSFDYPFYYYNLRENAENRVKHFMSKNKATDYSKSEHWLSLPASVDKEVDVFWISPTAWQKVDDNDSNICNINDPTMLIGTKLTFYKGATAFENVGNIYAPYYRQADAASILSSPSLEERDKFVGGIPKSDVFAAFDYYIKNYNNGRPFILASHSQGTMIARFLLSEYMKENPDVYSRMIAAYAIGYSVTDEYLAENPHLKFAEGPNDTGVIISYNTEAPGVTDNPLVFPGAIAINPITWTREETLATAEQSLGSRVINAQLQAVFMKNYADAQVNKTRGTVITTTVDAKASNTVGLPDGVYHSYDYPFYYYNIRENAENRTKNFLSKQSTNNQDNNAEQGSSGHTLAG